MQYFSARDLIINQLKASLASTGLNCRVLAVAGWKQALEQLQPSPVLFVWHQTDRIPTNASGNRSLGKHQIVDQVWNVALAVRNVADIAGSAAQDDANTLMPIVLGLQGRKFDVDHGHFYRVQSAFQSAYVNGVGIFPFAFSTRIFT
jgi:hypothetical protein